jgi:NADPH:quinone reductase-like Zn-dependent oxidoreductase
MSGTMHAIAVAGGKLTLAEVAPPAPARDEAVVRVAAISLNRGEVKRSASAADGFRPGWDFAGTVEQPAARGGPPAGARVVGILPSGAWAERVAAPVQSLAVLPDAVSFEAASCLPVAGLTALHGLSQGGLLLGRRVLVTGATGGVGHLACRLAALAGAHVVGVVRDDAAAEAVRGYGAHEVAVIGDDPARAAALGPFDVILDSVGGASLTASLGMLASKGVCVTFGVSDAVEAAINAQRFYTGGGLRLYGLALFHELATVEPASVGLARLLGFVADGRLAPEISVTRPWTEVATVAADLIARRYRGKAVLTL